MHDEKLMILLLVSLRARRNRSGFQPGNCLQHHLHPESDHAIAQVDERIAAVELSKFPLQKRLPVSIPASIK
jgi:hypothetical protein